MNYPTEWWIKDKIHEELRGVAKSHEVDAFRSDVGRLESSLREARSEIAELRSQVSGLQDAVIQIQQEMLAKLEGLAANLPT